jgi:hypothetical protein
MNPLYKTKFRPSYACKILCFQFWRTKEMFVDLVPTFFTAHNVRPPKRHLDVNIRFQHFGLRESRFHIRSIRSIRSMGQVKSRTSFPTSEWEYWVCCSTVKLANGLEVSIQWPQITVNSAAVFYGTALILYSAVPSSPMIQKHAIIAGTHDARSVRKEI